MTQLSIQSTAYLVSCSDGTRFVAELFMLLPVLLLTCFAAIKHEPASGTSPQFHESFSAMSADPVMGVGHGSLPLLSDERAELLYLLR